MREMYDVVIVGGRPAGASLAARLGLAGVRTLVVDRAKFPSYPAVSTPFLLPHAMALLDELGLSPDDYAPGAPWLEAIVLGFGGLFETRLPLAARAGRSRFVVVDRADFDGALWESLARCPSVTRRDGWTVTGLVREGERVVGVRGRGEGGEVELRARAVVGADGRYSRVAREVGAEVVHAREDVPTHIYYAFWEGVAPFDDGPAVGHVHTSLDGWSFVFMPMSRGRVSVVAQSQSALWEAEAGAPAAVYERALRARPAVWRRLADARRVSAVSGIKRCPNLFREAAGPGWALVGDAWHQKDSLDAQGIYDALVASRFLAAELVRWHRGEVAWDAAMASYAARATGHLRPMFEQTMERLKREIYSTPPRWVAQSALRWLLTDPTYLRRFGEVAVRLRDPADFVTPGLVARALGRGAWGSLRGVGRRSGRAGR